MAQANIEIMLCIDIPFAKYSTGHWIPANLPLFNALFNKYRSYVIQYFYGNFFKI